MPYTLYDLVRYARSLGDRSLVGEQSAFLSTFCAFVMGRRPVLVESFRGSGKTILLDAIMRLIPENLKFEVRLSSPQYLYYKQEKLNSVSFLSFPELQKVADNPVAVEVLKDFGEGKKATRGVTDITLYAQGKEGTREMELDPKPFITTVALENQTFEVQKLGEFLRRVIRVHTDPGKEQTEQVIDDKLLHWAGLHDEPFNEAKRKGLETHVARCINKMVDPDTGVTKSFINPGAQALKSVIPLEFAEARSALPHFMTVAEGICVFDETGIQWRDKLLVAPVHLWLAWRVYGETFLQQALNQPAPLGKEILAVAQEPADQADIQTHECSTAADIWEALRDIGYSLTRDQLQKLLDQMVFSGWLGELEGMGTRLSYYYRSSLREESVNPNWSQVIEVAQKVVVAKYSEKAEVYIRQYCPGNIEVVDPITGENVKWFRQERGRPDATF